MYPIKDYSYEQEHYDFLDERSHQSKLGAS
jgi:hypothetical protein